MEPQHGTQGGGQPSIIIQNKGSGIPAAITALALIALIGIVLIIGGFLLVGLVVSTRQTTHDGLQEVFVAGDKKADDEAALIAIDGVILEPSAGGLFQRRSLLERVNDRLDRAAATGAKAVILEINSPGGGITATDVIYRRIVKFKATHPDVPVVVHMKDIAASGGYYVAAPADWIVAMPSTLTASIGVILTHHNLAGFIEGKLGIKSKAFTSGKQKDILSLYREMRPDEAEHIQSIIDEMYGQFVDIVVRGRKGRVTEEAVRALESTILTGRQAHAKGLVDQIGTLEDAVAKAAELAKVAKLKVVRYDKPPSTLERMLDARVAASAPPVFDLESYFRLGGSPFLYLWSLGP